MLKAVSITCVLTCAMFAFLTPQGALALEAGKTIASPATQSSVIDVAAKRRSFNNNNGNKWCVRQCRYMWGVKKKRCLCRCEDGVWMGGKKSGKCVYY